MLKAPFCQECVIGGQTPLDPQDCGLDLLVNLAAFFGLGGLINRIRVEMIEVRKRPIDPPTPEGDQCFATFFKPEY